MKYTHRFLPRAIALGILLLSTSLTRATAIDPVSFDEMTDRAEMIFEGVVTNVDYRMSEQDSPDQPRLPFTFVTFYIERTMKGSSLGGDAITLRFDGGPAGDGKFLYIPGMPLFDLGDREVLFVRGNGTAITPLVGWGQGRFRIIRGELFSDDGRELHATAAGGLGRGLRHQLEEVSKNRIGDMEIETVTGGEEDQEPDTHVAPESGPRTPRLSVDNFERLIRSKVNARNGRGAAAVASADPGDRIVVPAEHPAAPPDRPDR